jgi:putative sigma-54 modulation protein
MEVRIQSVRFDADEKLIDYIESKLEKAKKFNDRIITMDVFLKLENSGQVRDKIVELKAHIPGKTLFVEDDDKTFEAAFDKAMNSLTRQLRKKKEIIKNRRN